MMEDQAACQVVELAEKEKRKCQLWTSSRTMKSS